MRLEKSSDKSATSASQDAVEQAQAPSQAVQLKAQAHLLVDPGGFS